MSITEVNFSVTEIFKKLQNQALDAKNLHTSFAQVVGNELKTRVVLLEQKCNAFVEDYHNLFKSLPLPTTAHQYQLIPVQTRISSIPEYKPMNIGQNESIQVPQGLPVYLAEKIKLLTQQLPKLSHISVKIQNFAQFIQQNQQQFQINYQTECLNQQIHQQLKNMSRNIDKAMIQLKAFQNDLKEELPSK